MASSTSGDSSGDQGTMFLTNVLWRGLFSSRNLIGRLSLGSISRFTIVSVELAGLVDPLLTEDVPEELLVAGILLEVNLVGIRDAGTSDNMSLQKLALSWGLTVSWTEDRS